MTKEEAVQWYKEIQSGRGVDRNNYLDVLRLGEIPKAKWNDGLFTLGIEYGVLIALIEIFNLSTDDIEGE